MTISFRKAVTAQVKPLIGLYAESGRGKTYSALLLAKGFAEDMAQVGMIETESGRGEAFADDPVVGGYCVLSLREDFSPKAYGAAIRAAEQAGLTVLIVDSASHEWEGVGGVLAMAAANQAGGKKGPLVWQQPKIDHQREFMLRLMQTPIPLVIVCMRAKYVMEEVNESFLRKWQDSGATGRPPKIGDWIRSPDLSPKQSEDILYEMFLHGWIDPEHRLHVTKYTISGLRDIFPNNQPITVETGERLAAWSKSTKPKNSPPPVAAGNGESPPVSSLSGDESGGGEPLITPDQSILIEDMCRSNSVPLDKLKSAAGVEFLRQIKAADYPRAIQWIERAIEKRKAS